MVPVVKAEAAGFEPKVSVEMDVPGQVTSRVVTITLRAGATSLFARPRRVVVEVNGRPSDPKELSLTAQQVAVSLSWLEFHETPPARVTIRLLDADGGHLLQQAEVPVSMIV